MNKILFLLCLNHIFSAVECQAMNELSDYLEKLSLSSTPLCLQLPSESNPKQKKPKKKFTPATPWQEDSLMNTEVDAEIDKENILPKSAIKQKKEKDLANVAKQVDAFLAAREPIPQKKNPDSTRGETFYIPR